MKLELRQELEPGGVLEPEVQEQAVGNRVDERVEELARRAHCADLEGRPPEQPRQGRAHTPVVVHDPDDRSHDGAMSPEAQ